MFKKIITTSIIALIGVVGFLGNVQKQEGVSFINLVNNTFAACYDPDQPPCAESEPVGSTSTNNPQSPSSSSSPTGQAGNITTTDFTIKTCDLNPLSSGSCGTPRQGKGALNYVLTKISELLLYFIPIIAGISFIIAGYYYILSSGDSEKASQAKTIIKWNIVAIFIAFFSYILVKLIAWVIT